MKKLFVGLAMAMLIGASSSALASSSYTGKITGIHSGPNVGPITFIIVEGEKQVDVAVPCDNNLWYTYAFDASTEAGKVTLTMAMTAYAANKTVYLGGLETCNLHSSVEDLRWIRLQ